MMRWSLCIIAALVVLGFEAIDAGKPFYAWCCYISAVTIACLFLYESEAGRSHLMCNDDEKL